MSEGPFLLCTDLDRTLLPNGPAPEDAQARPLLAHLVAHPEVVLVYVTGRDRGRVEQAMAEYGLPRPDLVIADVGTTIYDLRGGSWERWEAWDAEIAPTWGGRSHAELAAALQDIGPLRLQEASRQGPFKLSYEVGLQDDRHGLDPLVERRLEAIGVRAARIWSVDELADTALLDVVPLGATKVHAVSFVRQALQIPLTDMLFAGDSGNDLQVLTSEIPSVLVANARPEVVEEATRLAASAGTSRSLHLARGGFRGMSGRYGAGILEGMAHFHPRRTERWLPTPAVGGGRLSAPLPGSPLIFGEVLFDCFEDGSRVLGGAPFNVAWHVQGFGGAPTLVSRIGDDPSGRQILQRMRDHGMTVKGVQRDATHPTGEVVVRLRDGEPSYTIAADRSWDHVAADELPEGPGSLLYHGTLALRSAPSRQALEALLARHEGPVFVDVNLRPPFWEVAEVLERVHRADWVKLNADELDALGPGSGSLHDRARAFVRAHSLTGLVVTLGARGAMAIDASGVQSEVAPSGSPDIVDTVGAGDAFASVLILGILSGWPLPTMLARAQAFASRAVTWRGAVPADASVYDELLRTWATLDAPSES